MTSAEGRHQQDRGSLSYPFNFQVAGPDAVMLVNFQRHGQNTMLPGYILRFTQRPRFFPPRKPLARSMLLKGRTSHHDATVYKGYCQQLLQVQGPHIPPAIAAVSLLISS